MRGPTDEPPRQSPFTEVRGKRQQYDVVDISDDDDDDVAGAGHPNIFHWHQPGRQSGEPPSHTITLAEAAAFGVQEGGPTVTHHTIPAGEESDSDGLSSPIYDPYRAAEPSNGGSSDSDPADKHEPTAVGALMIVNMMVLLISVITHHYSAAVTYTVYNAPAAAATAAKDDNNNIMILFLFLA